MKIYIDPGHGGHDSGAVGNGFLEKDLVLDISLRQKDLFEKLGHKVKMSRATDKFVPLSDRVNEANNWGADVFISNHINAGGGEGIEVWHSIYGGKGKEYASNIQKKLSSIFKSRGIKSKIGKNGDYLYVIRSTKMPAILNEFGFMDNVNDVNQLKREDIRQKIAESVVYGVLGNKSEERASIPKLKRLLFYKNIMLKGDDVKLVQERLKKLGFNPGVIDGIYGDNTKKAVMKFQRLNGLAIDGIVGPKTWERLM